MASAFPMPEVTPVTTTTFFAIFLLLNVPFHHKLPTAMIATKGKNMNRLLG
jgi:hypothetical protein